MRISLPALLILIFIVLSLGQGSVHIGGSDGLALLKNLTDKAQNITSTNNSINNTSNSEISNVAGNLSKDLHIEQGSISIGNGGKVALKSLSNSTLNFSRNNSSSELWSWGGKPLPPPTPSAEDYILYRDADVVKANRE